MEAPRPQQHQQSAAESPALIHRKPTIGRKAVAQSSGSPATPVPTLQQHHQILQPPMSGQTNANVVSNERPQVLQASIPQFQQIPQQAIPIRTNSSRKAVASPTQQVQVPQPRAQVQNIANPGTIAHPNINGSHNVSYPGVVQGRPNTQTNYATQPVPVSQPAQYHITQPISSNIPKQQMLPPNTHPTQVCNHCRKAIPANVSVYTCLICSTANVSVTFCIWCFTAGTAGSSHPHNTSYYVTNSDLVAQAHNTGVPMNIWTIRKNVAGRLWYTHNATGYKTHIKPSPEAVLAFSGLPPNWEERLTPDGRTFYFNARSGASSWTKPSDSLPSGWKVLKTPDLVPFYVNEALCLSTWDRPGEQPKSRLGQGGKVSFKRPVNTGSGPPSTMTESIDLSAANFMAATKAAARLTGQGVKIAGRKMGDLSKPNNLRRMSRLMVQANNLTNGGSGDNSGGYEDQSDAVGTQEPQQSENQDYEVGGNNGEDGAAYNQQPIQYGNDYQQDSAYLDSGLAQQQQPLQQFPLYEQQQQQQQSIYQSYVQQSAYEPPFYQMDATIQQPYETTYEQVSVQEYSPSLSSNVAAQPGFMEAALQQQSDSIAIQGLEPQPQPFASDTTLSPPTGLTEPNFQQLEQPSSFAVDQGVSLDAQQPTGTSADLNGQSVTIIDSITIESNASVAGDGYATVEDSQYTTTYGPQPTSALEETLSAQSTALDDASRVSQDNFAAESALDYQAAASQSAQISPGMQELPPQQAAPSGEFTLVAGGAPYCSSAELANEASSTAFPSPAPMEPTTAVASNPGATANSGTYTSADQRQAALDLI